jgi:hypothetical protein
MTEKEYQTLLIQEPALAGPIQRAAAAATPAAYGTPTELAAIALLFPIVSFAVRQIGLPWLYEAKRYAELWRLKFHAWIDGQSRKAGFDPDQAEKAGEALRAELEKITDRGSRAAWERFAEILSKEPEDKAPAD